jgi:hypothetical protein
MAAPRPLPPFVPESQAQFLEHVSKNPIDWFQYCQDAYNYMGNADPDTDTLRTDNSRLRSRVQGLEEDNKNSSVRISQLEAIIEYQEAQHQKHLNAALQRTVKAEVEKNKALALAEPAVPIPRSSPRPTPNTEEIEGPTTRTLTPAPAAPPQSSRPSEKLPDPDHFSGDRSDLRRFVQQVYAKMTANLDRFPNPQSRMAYVNSRLQGKAWNLVLPYLQKGQCSLSDYPAIVDLLERAFGNPDQERQARQQLFSFRQKNQEFSAFLAEF